jgi:hypothetical protein
MIDDSGEDGASSTASRATSWAFAMTSTHNN